MKQDKYKKQLHTNFRTHPRDHAHMCTRNHTCINTHSHTHTQWHTQTYTHTGTGTRTRIHIHVHTHTHALTRMHILHKVQLDRPFLSIRQTISVNFQRFSRKKTQILGCLRKTSERFVCGNYACFAHLFLPAGLKETDFRCCLVGTKLIVDLFWQALVKLILRTLERDILN